MNIKEVVKRTKKNLSKAEYSLSIARDQLQMWSANHRALTQLMNDLKVNQDDMDTLLQLIVELQEKAKDEEPKEIKKRTKTKRGK